MNVHFMTGNVGKDPEIRTFESGTKSANFSFATTTRWRKDGEKKERTEWHRCVAFGKLAELIEKYVKQGSKLALLGEVRYRNYDDRDGNKKYITEVYVDKMEFLGGAKKESPQDDVPQSQDPNIPDSGQSGNDDDLPF